MGATLAPGSLLDLEIERPVAGGRMLARHDGQIVLVAGAIPGERVRARLERCGRGVAFAAVIDVLEPSAARRPAVDPACGGHVYAHIDYREQAAIKRAVLLDALGHGGRVRWERDLPVHTSSERGYRMRARLHVRDGRIGFFREGSHDLCGAAVPGQLLDATVVALDGLLGALPGAAREALDWLELTENLPGDERAVHLAWREGTRVGSSWMGPSLAVGGINGVSVADRASGLPVAVSGVPSVSDPLTAIVPDARGGAGVRLRRHAPAFFQANRHLLTTLVSSVVRHVAAETVVDLYAGVGLFALSLAASGKSQVTAVEGDAISGMDLTANAAALGGPVLVERRAVEAFLERQRLPAGTTIVVDPPRTGMSRAALDGIIAARASRLVYVSCDVATLARDLRRLIDAGYALEHLEAFDLFPNTAHVETLAVLDRRP